MNIGRQLNLIKKYLIRYKAVPVQVINKMAPIIRCSDPQAFAQASQFLKNGEVIAVPTDTIYGLASSAMSSHAVEKLYKIKGRDCDKPVAICVSSIRDIRQWGVARHLSDQLLKSLLPGPVTIVLEKTEYLDNPKLNPKNMKIGIRIPKNEFINQMTKCFDFPVALTSANLSNERSPLSISEFEHLYSHLGAVFDDGELNEGLDQNRTGSTVVDLSQIGMFKIIRKGISYENVITTLQGYGLRYVF